MKLSPSRTPALRTLIIITAVALLGAVSCKSKKPSSKDAVASATSMPSAAGSSARPQRPKLKPIAAPADVATPPADGEKTESGLVMKVLKPGTGKDHPKPEDTVSVHYTGWSKDGEMFDSSESRGRPSKFRVRGVIKGWTEALGHMVVGERRRLWIPGPLAYGDAPRKSGPFGQLTFEVELLEIIEAPKPPAVPEDVKAAPKTAKKTKSGLAYRQLQAGTGKDHPKETDRVRVHYSGWTTDGKMFDSSVTRGQPTSFGLNRVIKGWTEGVQLMVEGEKMRFWIPAALAYGDKAERPGAPSGMLVFDIELVKILPPTASPH